MENLKARKTKKEAKMKAGASVCLGRCNERELPIVGMKNNTHLSFECDTSQSV
jgi:hypothetical protein